MSCLVGFGISYTGIWVQSMISAASFLVLVNANKFAIIIFGAFSNEHAGAFASADRCRHLGCL